MRDLSLIESREACLTAMCGAWYLAGDAVAARREVELAREGAVRIEEAEDRELLLADLATIPL